MSKPMRRPTLLACLLSLGISVASSSITQANENVVGKAKPDSTITPQSAKSASAPPGRIFTDEAKLPPKARAILNPNGLEAAGDENHPFTTKRASSLDSKTPVDKFPWSATGKLWMKFDSDTFVCTASVVRKGLLVTAAHCVHNFGKKAEGFADTIAFEPARHEDEKPFGKWEATEWWIPKAYFDGTDKCTTPGVVCENDVAIVVIGKRNGKLIGEEVGSYDFPKNDVPNGDEEYGYFTFLDREATQITQLGYPSQNFDGDKMIRTDSLGYQDVPNTVIIGSNQTGGSSGGPWLENFGTTVSEFTGSPATDDKSNMVVATTSWGFISDTLKVQGASRFAKNSIYTIKSNIQSLVDEACAKNPWAC